MSSTMRGARSEGLPAETVRSAGLNRGDIWLASSSRDPDVFRLIVFESLTEHDQVIAMAVSNLIEMAADSDLVLAPHQTGLSFPALVQSLVVGPLMVSQLVRPMGKLTEPTLDALATLRVGDTETFELGATTAIELRACPPEYRRYQGPPLTGFSGARWRFKQAEAAAMRALCAEAYDVLAAGHRPATDDVPTLDERRLLRDEVVQLLTRGSRAPGLEAAESGDIANVAFEWIPRGGEAEDDLVVDVILPERYAAIRGELVIVVQDPPDRPGGCQRAESLAQADRLKFTSTPREGRLVMVDRVLERLERQLALAAASGEGPYQDSGRRYRADVSRDADGNGTVTFDGPPGRDIEWVEFVLSPPHWSYGVEAPVRRVLVPMYAESNESRRRATIQVTAEDTIPDGPLRTLAARPLDRISVAELRESVSRSVDDPWTMSAWRAVAREDSRVASVMRGDAADESDVDL